MRPALPVSGLLVLGAVSIALTPACNNMPIVPESGSLTIKKALVFKGYTWVTNVAFSPDGNLVLSRSWDGTIRLWDVATGQESKCLEGAHDGAAFSPDGSRIASVGKDRTIRLWEVKSGKEIRCFLGPEKGPDEQPYYASCLAFSPDGQRLAAGGSNATTLVWNVESGKLSHCLKAPSGNAMTLAFNPAGPAPRVRLCTYLRPVQLLSGYDDNSLHLWDLETGKELLHFGGQGESILSVACSPDGFQALTGENQKPWSKGGFLRLWDLENGNLIRTLEGHEGPVNCVAFSPDGRRALSGSGWCGIPDWASSVDNSMRQWDVATGKELARFQGHCGGITAVAFSPDGTRAVSGSSDTTLRLWTLPKETPAEKSVIR